MQTFPFFCRFHCFSQKWKRCRWSKASRKLILCRKIRICAGTDAKYQIPQMQIFPECTCRADPDNIFHIITIEQLIRINAHWRHSHAARHHRNSLALISSRITWHLAHRVDQNCIFQIMFRYKSRPQRITRHQYCFCKITLFCLYMRCRNIHKSILSADTRLLLFLLF